MILKALSYIIFNTCFSIVNKIFDHNNTPITAEWMLLWEQSFGDHRVWDEFSHREAIVVYCVETEYIFTHLPLYKEKRFVQNITQSSVPSLLPQTFVLIC